MLVHFACNPFILFSDENVLDLLAIADEFVVDKLSAKCEGFLLSKSRKSPLELLKVATTYRLKSLMELSLVRVSRMPGLIRQMDKEDLGLEIENRILRLVVERYKSSRVQCCVHALADEGCCYEKTRLSSLSFDMNDSSDDEESICSADYLNPEDYYSHTEFEASDGE